MTQAIDHLLEKPENRTVLVDIFTRETKMESLYTIGKLAPAAVQVLQVIQ